MESGLDSDLPQGWVLASIADVSQFVRGVAFGKEEKRSEPGDGLIACLRTTNIQREVELEDLWFIPRSVVRNADQFLKLGDTLMSTANSFELVGKVALLRQLPCEATLGAFIGLLRPRAGIHPKYLYFHLARSETQSAIRATSSTTTNISNISASRVGPLTFPLAPSLEQGRIAEGVEEEFARLEAAVQSLEAAKRKLTAFRASVLQAAVEGRLVPTEAELSHKHKMATGEDRPYETGAELLARILKERRERWEADQVRKFEEDLRKKLGDNPPKLGTLLYDFEDRHGAEVMTKVAAFKADPKWRAKYKEPTSPDTSNLPALPEGWVWANLEQLSESVKNGSSVVPNADDGVPMLRISAIRPMEVRLEESRFAPSNLDYSDYQLQAGDALFTRYNGNAELVGVCGVVKAIPRGMTYPDKLIRVRLFKPLVFPYFFELASNAGHSREFCRNHVKTTAGQAGISGGDLKCTPIPLPPVAEQIRIADECERLLDSKAELTDLVSIGHRRAERLRQAILRAAFAGKLVPQGPTDEHASVLLERIRSSKEERWARSTRSDRRGDSKSA